MKRILLTGLLLLFSGIVFSSGWLLNSESGLRWIYQQAGALLPGTLHSQQLAGSISGGVILHGLEYRDDEINLAAGRLILHWNPWALLRARVDIARLEAQQLDIVLRQSDDDPSSKVTSTNPPILDLPLDLQLQALEVDRLRLDWGEDPLRLEQVTLQAASRGSRISITAFTARVAEFAIEENQVNDFEISLAGDIDTAGNYAHALEIGWQTRLPGGDIIINSTRVEGDLSSTRLTQQTRGPVQADLKLVLQDPLGQLNWQTELKVSSFDTALLDSTLPVLRGNLALSAQGDLHSAQATGELEADSTELGQFKASFDLRSLESSRLMDGVHVAALQLDIFEGELAAQGQLYWSPLPSWDSTVSASNINPAGILPDWPGSLGGRLQTRGRFEDGKLFASASLADLSGRLRGYPLSLRGEAQWRDDTLDIETADLESGGTRISANGSVAGNIDLDWSLDSRDLAELYPAAQGQLVASGHLGGQAGAPVIKARFDGKAIRLDDYAVDSIDGDIELDLLKWQRLYVDFKARQVQLKDQRLQSIDVNADQGRITASLVAANASAEIELDGALHEQGWHGKLVRAEIDSEDFDTWRLQAPAVLNLSRNSLSSESLCLRSSQQANICASFRQREENWDLDLDLTSVPLQMMRRWTPAELDLDGVINATADLQYSPENTLLGKIELDFPAASARYPLQQGRPQSFDYQQARLDLLLESAQAKVTTRLALKNGDRLEASAVFPQANMLQLDLERQTMQANVSIEARNWEVLDALIPELEIKRGEMKLKIDAEGLISRPQLLFNGRLDGGAIHLPGPEIKLDQIEITLQSSSLERVEYSAEARTATGRLKIHGNTLLDWDNGWPSTLRFSGEDIDMASVLAPWILPPLTIDGRLQANGEFSYHAPDQLFGELRLSSAQGRLEYPLLGHAVEAWDYQDARVTLSFDEQGIKANSGLDIGGSSDIVAEMTLPRARLLALDFDQQPLRASAQVSFEELNLIQLLIPEVDRLEGELTLNLAVTGNLARPLVSAQAKIPLASFNIPRLGLQVEQLSLLGESDESNRFNFRISAASGDGHLAVHGSSHLESSNHWTARLQIKGSDFEIARIPEAQVSISPDLTVNVDGRNILIEGNLLIPRARLEPRDIRTAARVSNDSVIIGGDEPDEQRWQISTRVNLALGDQVRFVGFGFDGNFGGRLLIEDKPGELTTGTGEITIRRGRYRAYGQRLEVNGGRLIFGGGAIDNPGLDLRAQRQVSGVTVGLAVGGRLQQPKIELFSVPAMGETDMLSYLLLGRPLESATSSEGAAMASAALALGLASGNFLANRLGDDFGIDEVYFDSNDSGDEASLVIGRYLSPKMYVSYGVGLVESLNTLTLRYQLAEKWHLEAETGRAQGADLLFTIER